MEHEPLSPEVQEASQVAVHAARNAAQALEISRQQQVISIGDIVQERFEHVLAQGTEQEKSIILARVPYICQDIKGINAALATIITKMDDVKNDLAKKDENNEKKYLTQDSFAPYKWVLTITGGVVITTLVAAILAQVLIK